MFEPWNPLSYEMIRERLADLERERLADRAALPLGNLISLRWEHLSDRLGDILISIGARLKHQSPCSDGMRQLLWVNRK